MGTFTSPLIPDSRQWAESYNRGFEQGEALRRRNLLLEAGALAAASPAMSAPTVAPAAGGMNAYSNAISSIESGGRYDTIGPATRSGDRAYGKYQVMGANIPAWTRKHLGRELTPQQFLADKDAQEKVFAGEFGGYVQKYGNPQDAASMWFSGRPAEQGAGRNDGYTSQPEYLRRFNAALGGGGAPAPVQAVQARPLDPDAPLRNASNALLRGGELQAGLGLQNQLYERSEKARAQAEARRKEGEALFGELALRADTPEKWARAVEMARQGGLPVAGLEDFSAREFVIARAGKQMDYMSAGKRVFNKTTGQYVPADPNAPTDAESLSKQGTFVQDENGNWQIAQLNESGDPRIAKFPPGYRVMPPTYTVGTGTSEQVLSRPGGTVMNSIPKDVAGEALAKEAGKSQAERQAQQPEAQLKVETAVANLDALRDEVKKLKSMPGLSSATGAWQSRLPNVWQSTADADSSINNIKGKAATSALQAMRDASKTGGAVGNVTEKEWPILESMIGNLDRSQGDKLFVERLNELEKYTEDAKARIISAHQRAYGSSGQAGPSSGAIDSARAAIARGAPRDAVIQRLRENGIDPSGL